MRAGIESLVSNFPYEHFTNEEIVKLFTKYGFSLGITDSIILKIVQHFKTLTKQNLSYVLHGILNKIDKPPNNDNIDLSLEVLPLISIINS
jgi:hypothetical protein